MKAAIEVAHKVTTVSPRYAEEIKTEEFGCGLQSILQRNANKLCGIINGIDEELYDPHTDENIAKNYMWRSISNKKIDKTALQKELSLPEKDVPLFAMITRLASHKGIELVHAVSHMLLSNDVQLVVLGTGEYDLENFFRWLEEAYPDKMRALITYDRSLSRRVYAACDFFIMPSKSEPCGLAQMISCSYATIPLVRAVGGLKDTIIPYGAEGANGFRFDNYNAHELLFTAKKAISVYKDKTSWQALTKSAKASNFTWNNSAAKYISIYNNLLK
jgi:starch synthase